MYACDVWPQHHNILNILFKIYYLKYIIEAVQRHATKLMIKNMSYYKDGLNLIN